MAYAAEMQGVVNRRGVSFRGFHDSLNIMLVNDVDAGKQAVIECDQ